MPESGIIEKKIGGKNGIIKLRNSTDL